MKKYTGKTCNLVEPTRNNFILLSNQVCVFSNTKMAVKTTPYLRGMIENISKVCDVSLKSNETYIEPAVEDRFKNNDAIMVVSHMDTGGNGNKKVSYPIYYPYTYIGNPLVCDFKKDVVGYNPMSIRKWYTSFGSISGAFIFSGATRTERVLTVGGVVKDGMICMESFHSSSVKILCTITEAYQDVFAIADGKINAIVISMEDGVIENNLYIPMPCTFEGECENGDFVALQYVLPIKPDGSGECSLIAKI